MSRNGNTTDIQALFRRLRIGRLLMSRNGRLNLSHLYFLLFEDWPAFDVTEHSDLLVSQLYLWFEDWPAFDVTELHTLFPGIFLLYQFEDWPAFDVTELLIVIKHFYSFRV